jgi:diguanylate cyclase (GGDEF)-like protein/PAS domain S-box-containing protein
MGKNKLLSSGGSETNRKSMSLPGLFVPLFMMVLLGAGFWFITDNNSVDQIYVHIGFLLAGILALGLTVKGLTGLVPSAPDQRKDREKDTQEDLEKIIHSTPHPVIITDSDGRAVITNKWFNDMLGLNQEEDFCLLTDQRISSWELNDDFSRVLLGETVVLPETWKKLPPAHPSQDVREVCLRITLIPVRHSSSMVKKVYVKMEDCTRSKKLEQSIIQDHKRLREALEGARQVVCEMDPRTGNMLMDLQSSSSAGINNLLESKQLIDFADLVHPEDLTQLQQLIRQHASRKGTYFEHRFKMKSESGSWIWIQFRGKAFTSAGRDNPRFSGIMVDITREHEFEMQLKQSEARYRSMFANALEGMYLAGTDDTVICVNDAFAKILGYDSPDDFMSSRGTKYLSEIYYIARVREKRLEALREKGEILQMETQVLRKDRSLIWISENARALRDEQGKILYFEGSLTDITARKKSEERLLHQALFDQNTNLPNRANLTDKLDKALQKAASDQNFFFGLIFFDLDGLGSVNDSFGHFVGDSLLLAVSHRISKMLRAEDTLARLNSDEFGIIVQNRSSKEIMELAENLRTMLEEVFILDGHEIFITASFGVLFYNMTYTRTDDMLRDAELAMYKAKKQGKNRCVPFVMEMYQQKSQRALMEKDLRRALDRQELSINYQPIIKLDSSDLVGLEALIRWKHPDRGNISPDKFIPLAEATGLIEPIGDWVLMESCRQISSWREINNSLILNVNLSGKQMEKAGLEEKIYQTLQKANLEPESLNLEVTESMAMTGLDSNIRTLKRLKYMGVRLSIDDFGTGYSSLAHLQRFPLDELKIDRSFINTINLSKNNNRILQSIVELALGLNLKMVAEGIETQSQLEQVKALKCHYGQGFLFSRAMAPETIEKIWIVPMKHPAHNIDLKLVKTSACLEGLN